MEYKVGAQFAIKLDSFTTGKGKPDVLTITDETEDMYFVRLSGGGGMGIPKTGMDRLMADNSAKPMRPV